MVLHGIVLYLTVLYGIDCIDVGGARAVSRKTPIYFIGVVLGVDSRLGYWDLVGGGEIRNMVFFIIIIIDIVIIKTQTQTPHSPLIEARTPL